MANQSIRAIQTSVTKFYARNFLYRIGPKFIALTLLLLRANPNLYVAALPRYLLPFLNDFEILNSKNKVKQTANLRAVAQLVEWSLPTPEVRSSNPVIRKIYTLNI